MNAQEANGEQREKNGGKFAETDDFGRAVLKRKPPETAPTLGKRAKKIPTDKGWDFTLWCWRQLNLFFTTSKNLYFKKYFCTLHPHMYPHLQMPDAIA